MAAEYKAGGIKVVCPHCKEEVFQEGKAVKYCRRNFF